ncbi:MAG: hypothetical protein U1E59_20275, partial [Amaricoccus sp.]
WASKALHPNARVHRLALANSKRKARWDAYCCAREAGVVRFPKSPDGAAQPLSVDVTFQPPDRRRRDLDGMISQGKAYFDGIADATGVDDSLWQWAFRVAEPVRGGCVLVALRVADGGVR